MGLALLGFSLWWLRIWNIAFSHDDHLIAAVVEGRAPEYRAMVWSLPDGRCLHSDTIRRSQGWARFTPDGTGLACGKSLIDLRRPREKAHLLLDSPTQLFVDFYGSGPDRILTMDGISETLELWDVPSHTRLRSWPRLFVPFDYAPQSALWVSQEQASVVGLTRLR